MLELLTSKLFLLFLFYSWSLTWKGMALWHAAINKQSKWFISFLLLNTLGILEILYLIFFQNKKLKRR
ncbi:hypothetical protein HOD61_02120 [archaeon]|jgi:hypothetical protein|nr:hypothetical protein [archaeon]